MPPASVAPPLPCVFEGLSGWTDLPRALPSGLDYCLNFALLAIVPVTGYVYMRPKKLCLDPLLP